MGNHNGEGHQLEDAWQVKLKEIKNDRADKDRATDRGQSQHTG